MEVIEHGGVLVEGQEIAWVGPVDQLGADRRDTAGRTDLGAAATILPGLIDSHVHLGFDGGEDGQAPGAQLLLRALLKPGQRPSASPSPTRPSPRARARSFRRTPV